MSQNPYTRLKALASAWAYKAAFPKRTHMWLYPKAKLLDNTWTLADLYQRVAAAEQLTHDVVLRATDDGLVVEYRERCPQIPFEFR